MSRPPRLSGFAYRGPARYFLTLCTRHRLPFFLRADTVARTRSEFLRIAVDERFAVLAYCFMPNHLHALVEGEADASDLRVLVYRVKRRTGRVHAAHGAGPLWQEGYHDRILREDEHSRSVARYIIDNPVRAGLTTTPTAYPYLGSAVWSIDELIASTS